MGTAFLLLSCKVNKNIEVADTIQKLSGIAEAVPTIGAYDCIVKTENLTHEDIDNLVLISIRPLDHIRSILTMCEAPKVLSTKNV